MTTDTNKEAVRGMFAEMDRGDHAAWRARLAPDFTASMAGNDHDMTADEFAGMARMFAASFANGRHIIDSQVAEGDWVETRLTWTALHIGDFNGVPASQRPVSIEGVTRVRLVNGRIAEHRALVDVMSLMAQIGAFPAAA